MERASRGQAGWSETNALDGFDWHGWDGHAGWDKDGVVTLEEMRMRCG
jgi:hypothetical protein